MITFKQFVNENVLQPGAEFEQAFYNQATQILKRYKKFNLKLNKKTYAIVGVEPPAGAETTKADLVFYTEDQNDLLISLKQYPFVAYAGIAGKGRPYFQEIANHPAVKKYIVRLKKYLAKQNLCVENPKSIPNSTAEEQAWLKQNKPTTGKLTSNTVCSRGGQELYWIPKDDPDFVNLIVFGSPKFRSDKDHVDYVIKGKKGLQNPFVELSKGTFTISNELSILPYKGKVDGDLLPVFFSRTANKRHAYGILNTRTQIVPYSEAANRAIKI